MAQKSAAKSQPISAPHRALYRKYRPTTLDQVVGQEQVTTPLQNALNSGKLSHAYLFIGPRGTGKTSVARIFAHAVNGFDYQIEDNYLDIIEIDAASNTGVDNIRELREKAVIAPTKGKYKVYIIDEVHMLTKSASNALLKTLEEPPEHVIFIMATTDAYKVPITISSRTQVHTFKLAEPQLMQAHLRRVADAEGLKITDSALAIVARRGGGSFRDSLSLLDQVSALSDGEITAELLLSALGLPQAQALETLLTSYVAGDSAKIESTLRDLLNSGLKPETIASELITNIIAAPRPELLPLLAKLPEVQPPFPEAKLLLSFLWSEASRSASPAKPLSHPAPAPKALETPPTSSLEAPEAPATPPAPKDSPAGQPFAWEAFLEQIHLKNDAIYLQLQKVEYQCDGSTLHLYPQHKFTKNILDKPNNAKLIATCLDNLNLIVHDLGEKPPTKDQTLSQISAIMGDIREVTGEMPF